jgi:hypothetical protein
MTIHLDSTSAIARAGRTGAGPGQSTARSIRNMVCNLRGRGKTVDLVSVKGHESTLGNERVDVLVGRAAEIKATPKVMSIAHLKLQISEKFRHNVPSHHGTEEIPRLPLRSPGQDAKCAGPQRRRYALAIGDLQ